MHELAFTALPMSWLTMLKAAILLLMPLLLVPVAGAVTIPDAGKVWTVDDYVALGPEIQAGALTLDWQAPAGRALLAGYTDSRNLAFLDDERIALLERFAGAGRLMDCSNPVFQSYLARMRANPAMRYDHELAGLMPFMLRLCGRAGRIAGAMVPAFLVKTKGDAVATKALVDNLDLLRSGVIQVMDGMVKTLGGTPAYYSEEEKAGMLAAVETELGTLTVSFTPDYCRGLAGKFRALAVGDAGCAEVCWRIAKRLEEAAGGSETP